MSALEGLVDAQADKGEGIAADLSGNISDDGNCLAEHRDEISVNVAPLLADIDNRSIAVGSTLTFDATATDENLPADGLIFSIDEEAQALGMSMSSSGTFSWTPRVGSTSFSDISCGGAYKGHLQGLCTNGEDAVFWAYTSALVKTNKAGEVLRETSVERHHGDLCFVEDRIYVAVNLGRFNDAEGNADSWVYVYDAEDLSLLAKHQVEEVIYGAGGIGFADGHFYVVGGLPDQVEENYVYEYDADLQFVKKHCIDSGYTLAGIQTATYADGSWLFGCYGTPAETLETDAEFKLKGRQTFNSAVGLGALPNGDFLVGRTAKQSDGSWTGNGFVARAAPSQVLSPYEQAQEVQVATPYNVTVTVSDGSLTDSTTFAVTVVEHMAPSPVDLGSIDFRLLEHLSLADGSFAYQIETVRDGILSVQADSLKGSGDVWLGLYSTDPRGAQGHAPVAQSVLDAHGNQRIDWTVGSGETYYVEVGGNRQEFDVRIANLLHHDAQSGIVTVYGTDSNDTAKFDASGSRNVTINGVHYRFDNAQAEAMAFDGVGGHDTIELCDTPGDETLEAWSDKAVFTSGDGDSPPDFVVTAAGFEDLHAYARAGGTDTAILHGSASKDKMKSYEDFVRLRASNSVYSLRAKLFDRVVAEAGSEGLDTAVFHGAAGNDTFRYSGADNIARMESTGRDHRAVGFGTVVARAGGSDGNLAYLTDTPGEGTRTDDVFYFKSHMTKLVSNSVKVTVRAFDEVHATAGEGGCDVARIYDTLGDDKFEFDGDAARLYSRVGGELQLLYEAIGFQRVKTYHTTGNDPRDFRDHTFDLIQNGWED